MNDLVTFEIKTPTIIFEGDFINDLVTFEIKMPKVSFNILPTPTLEFDIQVSFVDGVGKTYTGPYEVIPQLYEDISLPTKGTTPKKNITVFKIPQYEVSNEAGGTTLILGGE